MFAFNHHYPNLMCSFLTLQFLGVFTKKKKKFLGVTTLGEKKVLSYTLRYINIIHATLEFDEWQFYSNLLHASVRINIYTNYKIDLIFPTCIGVGFFFFFFLIPSPLFRFFYQQCHTLNNIFIVVQVQSFQDPSQHLGSVWMENWDDRKLVRWWKIWEMESLLFDWGEKWEDIKCSFTLMPLLPNM